MPTLLVPVPEDAAPRALTAESTARYMAWLRSELEILPAWHILHPEYASQLASLERRFPPE